MNNQKPDYKYSIAAAGFIITVSTIIFFGGKSQQKLDNLIVTTDRIERQIPQLSDRVNRNSERIARLEEVTKQRYGDK